MSKKRSLRQFLRDLYPTFFSLRILAIAAGFTVLVVVAGPFGTLEAMTLPVRSLYWAALIGLSLPFGWLIRSLMSAWLQRHGCLAIEGATVIAMTISFFPIVVTMNYLARPSGMHGPLCYLCILLNLFLVVTVLSGSRLLDMSKRYADRDLEDRPENFPLLSDIPPLMRRMPEDMRGTILRLEAQDHHVLVTTEAGVVPLRIRLSDAIHEMGSVGGMMTHRSHWVAKDAIAGSEMTRGRKAVVRIRNGDRVPVSRTYRPALEKAGVIVEEC